MNGSFAAKMKARAQMHLMKEEQEQTSAVVRLQRWWIQMNGGTFFKNYKKMENLVKIVSLLYYRL